MCAPFCIAFILQSSMCQPAAVRFYLSAVLGYWERVAAAFINSLEAAGMQQIPRPGFYMVSHLQNCHCPQG